MNLVKQKLFYVTALWHPTKEQSEKGEKSKIILQPNFILANDEKSAGMQVIRAIPENDAKDLDQIEIAVKSF